MLREITKICRAGRGAECTELVLARKGLQRLTGLDSFPNLQSLWINNNQLVTLENLNGNFRLKALYAHNNGICSLKGSLTSLRSLNELDLSCNNIRDAEKVEKTLMCLGSLEALNLSNNPCCEEADYRLRIVHAIPSLKVLDCHVVQDWERIQVGALNDSGVPLLHVNGVTRTGRTSTVRAG